MNRYLLRASTTLILFALVIAGCLHLVEPTPAVPQVEPEDVTADTPAQPDQSGQVLFYPDLAYANLSPAQKLDLYLPAGEGPFPLVLIIHSGGFKEGDKQGSAEMDRVDPLLQAGYAVASANYRLSGEAIYPAQIQDVKTAVRFLRAHAGEYRLDAGHFGAWGSSAGGTLAALLGTTCGVAELEGSELGYADQSSCIQAVVDWFGLVDLLQMDAHFAGTGCLTGYNEADSAESQLVGAPLQTVPELVQKTNPQHYIDPADAPFFIQHGSADCRVPPVQSQLLAEALTAAIGADNVDYSVLEGAGHGGAAFKTEENMARVFAFLEKHLQ